MRPRFHPAPLNRELGKGSSKNRVGKLQNNMGINYFINMYISHHSATQDCYIHFNLYSQHVLAVTFLCCIATEIYVDEIIDINATGC
jgi:hypothetical protein